MHLPHAVVSGVGDQVVSIGGGGHIQRVCKDGIRYQSAITAESQIVYVAGNEVDDPVRQSDAPQMIEIQRIRTLPLASTVVERAECPNPLATASRRRRRLQEIPFLRRYL